MNKVRRMFSIWKKVQTYWKEAFPEEISIETKIQKRREEAKRQRELSEKIAKGDIVIDEHIPDWKKGALVRIYRAQDEEDNLDYEFEQLNRYRGYASKEEEARPSYHILGTGISAISSMKEAAKKKVESQVAFTDNAVLIKAKDLLDKVKDKVSTDLHAEMKERYPDFDPEIFEKELKYIFIDMYNSYLRHDLDHLQKVCGADAYSKFGGLIHSQIKKNLVHRYQEILNVADFKIDRGILNEGTTPLFICTAKMYEIECLVDKDEPEKMVEGNLNWPAYRDFVLFIIPHPKPDIETVGHEWVIIKAEDRSKNLQLEDKSEEQQNKSSDKDDKDNNKQK